jgi:hypothetical protein
MENKTHRNRKLADYIYNDLDRESVAEIEREISSDPELSESYQLNLQVKEYLKAKLQLQEMQSDPMLEDAEKLADMAFDTEIPDQSKHASVPVSRNGRRIRQLTFAIALAASVALLLSLLRPFNVDQNRLYDRYYAPLEASDYSQRGSSDEQLSAVARGINLYLEGEYAQSILELNTISFDPAFRAEVEFFSALSYMGLNQYKDAQSLFESLLPEENRYQLETLWYASLSYLKTGESARALSLLEQLEQYDGLYQKGAQRLRRKLVRIQ